MMSAAYIAAGVNHFRNPEMYLKIIPHFLPFHQAINYGSGVLEILLAVLLIPASTRNKAAWGLVILLVLIFPANIQMAVDYTTENHPLKWAAYARLPLQGLLIWWALSYTTAYRNWKHRKQSPPQLISPR